MKSPLIALTGTLSAFVGYSTAGAELQVGSGEGRDMLCKRVVTDSVQFGSDGWEQTFKS